MGDISNKRMRPSPQQRNSGLAHFVPGLQWKRKSTVSSGEAFVYFVVLMTAIAGFGGYERILGFRIGGWMWMVPLAISFLVLISPFRQRISFPVLPWIPLFAYVAWRTDFGERDDLQRLGIFLTPVLVGLAASSLPIKNIGAVRNAYITLFWIAIGSYLFAAVHAGSRMAYNRMYVPPGACMTLTLLAVAAYADYSQGRKRSHLILVACWLVCLLTESRMPVLVIPIMLVIGPWRFSLQRRMQYGVCLLVLGCVAFSTALVQRNLFDRGEGTLQDLVSMDYHKVEASGRLYAWPLYIEEIRKRPWLGTGGTASVDFGQDTFGGWSHPHNEYIRVLFDYGIVGFVLFFAPLLHLLAVSYRNKGRGIPEVQWLWTVSAGGILAMFLLAITGNVFMYVAWYGNLLFASLGVAMAASRMKSHQRAAHVRTRRKSPRVVHAHRSTRPPSRLTRVR